MLVAAVVILAGVVAVASGRGGEMAYTGPDYPPIDLGPVSAADVALLRPPSAAWGYNMRVTDEALEAIARAVTERDVQIAALQQQVSDLREQLGGEARPAAPGPASSTGPESPAAPGDLDDPLAPAVPADGGAGAEHDEPETPEPAWPGDPEPETPGAGSGPAAPVAITRPQPIYRNPFEPPEPPASQAPPWEAPAAPSTPDDHGWGADPATTSPDAKPLSWDAVPPAQQEPAAAGPAQSAGPAQDAGPAQSAGPAQDAGPAQSAGPAQDAGPAQSADPEPPADWGGPSQPAQAPSVWDVASRQVDEDQARRGRPPDETEFTWDEDPHQQLVWGAANSKAKAARPADDTRPDAGQRDGERG
jgi:hypothetical protein